jgi:hypothetical protein
MTLYIIDGLAIGPLPGKKNSITSNVPDSESTNQKLEGTSAPTDSRSDMTDDFWHYQK